MRVYALAPVGITSRRPSLSKPWHCPQGLRGPSARPSRGSLQTQLFQSPGTAGNEATRATPRGGGGRKGPAGSEGSRVYSPGRPQVLAPSPESAPAHTKISRGAAGNGLPPHPPGRTHPPSRPFTENGRLPIWTAFAGQNRAESPSTAHQVSWVKAKKPAIMTSWRGGGGGGGAGAGGGGPLWELQVASLSQPSWELCPTIRSGAPPPTFAR